MQTNEENRHAETDAVRQQPNPSHPICCKVEKQEEAANAGDRSAHSPNSTEIGKCSKRRDEYILMCADVVGARVKLAAVLFLCPQDETRVMQTEQCRTRTRGRTCKERCNVHPPSGQLTTTPLELSSSAKCTSRRSRRMHERTK